MKPTSEWTEDDIQQLIDQKIEEHSGLEYKACDALRADNNRRNEMILEISKDVSAFANANGGILIYGVVEKNHQPIKIDPNPYLPDKPSKEWLENIIDSNIKRKIDGIKIRPIKLTKSNPGKLIYVIDIPQSLQGAHQAKNFRYYQRRNFKAEPMEDYQVRDVMNRFKHPVIDAEVEFHYLQQERHEHKIAFGISLHNIGTVVANNFGLDILAPEIILDEQNYNSILSRQEFFAGKISESERGYRKLCYRNYGMDFVLFPSESTEVLSPNRKNRIIYKLNEYNFGKTYQYKIKLIMFADNMPPKTKEVNILNEF